MTYRRTLGQRVGVVAVALGFAIGATSAPTMAKPAKDAAVKCIEYGVPPKSPKGTIPRDDLHKVNKDPLARAIARSAASRTRAAAAADIQIPVRFLEIVKSTGNGGGNLSDARVAAQIDALNVGYAGTGFEFYLAENEEKVQPQWFNLIPANGAEPRLFRGSGKEVKMKKFWADNDPETLEVYSASLGQFLLGWAYFPSDFTDSTTSNYGPLHRYLDGVVIDYRTVPVVEGDSEGDQSVYPPGTYNEGDTLTHEVGHWLELYHTFQGGCSDSPSYNGGDQVADTPAEASPNFLCPEPGDEPRDTCPNDPGDDPVQNFMDYSFDSCLTEFTAGQAARMRVAWDTYRS